MEKEDGLYKLAAEWRGELREKNLAGRVLADFHLIKGLRAQKCPWHRIAVAMGVNPDSLRKLYLWTEAAIEAKRLEAPATTPAPAKAARPATARPATSAAQSFPLPGQKSTTALSEMDAIRAEFDT